MCAFIVQRDKCSELHVNEVWLSVTASIKDIRESNKPGSPFVLCITAEEAGKVEAGVAC